MLQLALRTLPLFAVIVAGAVALGTYLMWSGVRTTQLTLIEARMRMAVEDVAQVVEAAVSLGIAPAAQVTSGDLMARQQLADTAIRDMRLLSPDGSFLFGSVGAAPPDAGLMRVERPIFNDFGLEVARLTLSYDVSSAEDGLRTLGLRTASEALPVGLLATLLGSLLCLLALWRLRRRGARLAAPADRVRAPGALESLETAVAAERRRG